MHLAGRQFVRQHQPSTEELSMNSTKLASIGLAAALTAILPAVPAQAAQVARTFLSAAGSDSNNCANVTTPCRHLAVAFAATAVDGEIYVLDPANYGSLTITHAVSIEGHGWASIAPPSGGNAITINAGPTDKINIIGVVLDGTALATTNGIQLFTGGSLTVRDSVIRNFSGYGIYIGALNPLALLVSNTLISDISSNTNPNGSVYIGGTVTGVFDHVEVENGLHNGIILNGVSSFAVNFTISNSIIAKHGGDGIVCFSQNSTPTVLLVQNSTIAHNAASGLNAMGTGAALRVTKSAITDNGTGFATSSGGILESFGDNALRGNTTDGAPTTTVTLQ
jgi:hypothetical protein